MKIIESNKDSYWNISELNYSSKVANLDGVFIDIDTEKQFQKHLGFGGAFTSAVSYLICGENDKIRNEFVNAYFSKDGLGYNLGRIPIHSTDFSPYSYTYTKEDDRDLKTFDISCDYPRFDLIKECNAKANGLWLMTTPWSPLPWMKDNNDMEHGGKLKKEYYPLWASYQIKFIRAIQKYGIKIDAMSIQNEPLAKQVWESCIFTGEEEGDFITHYLYPLMEEYDLNQKIIIWDHNRDLIVKRAKQTFSVPGCEKLVWGLGYHWYCSNKFSNLSQFHNLYPDKHILLTECCVETAWDSSTGESSQIGIYEHGERYGRQIINDLNNYSEGYIDWNLVLNEMGGPNHVGNYCEAPIILNQKEHKLYYMPSYFFIGHFSKYIKPNAFRVLCQSDDEQILATAYTNPDGKMVSVIMNDGDTDKDVCISINKVRFVNFNLLAHSIVTIIE